MKRTKERPTYASSEIISAVERLRRQDGVDFARASVGLEGFKPHKDDEELSHRYVAGEIDIKDAIRAINEWALKQ